jgi:hypothetical protein
MARYVANSRKNLLYALSTFHLRCIVLSRCRGSDFVAPLPSAPAAPCRPYRTSRPLQVPKPPAKSTTAGPAGGKRAHWRLRSLTYSTLRSCQNPLLESVGTAPSHKSRTRSNRPALDATSRRSRYICRRTGRHQSAWFPIWWFRNAGR